MLITQAMTTNILSIGPAHTLRQAASLMSARRVGAAVVADPEAHGHGIITERDVMTAIGAGLDPDAEAVAAHLTRELVFANPQWTIDDAADAMVRGGFRHLIVLSNGEVHGILSVRDVLRVWTELSTGVVVAQGEGWR